jgi:hypothetical protein
MGRQRDTRNRMPPGMAGMAGLTLEDVLLNAPQAAPPMAAQPVPVHQPVEAAPQGRERVSGWRLLDRVLGGQTVTEGLDAERTRLQSEADRPQVLARMNRLRQAAEAMGPAAMIAFETNPEKFGESLAEQYAPQVIAAGGIQSVIGNGQRVGAPAAREFGDRIAVTDPLTGATNYSAPRPMTAAEETARINALNPMNVAPGGVLLDPRTGQEIGRGAERILSAADGVDVLSESGRPIYQNQRDAPVADPVAAETARRAAVAGEESRRNMAANLATGLAGARQFVGSAGVWSQYNPLNRQSRANLEGHLDTIKGNITFERLTEMKRNSPNGASGLGALSDNEARMLASTVAALNPDMSPEQLRRSFAVIDDLVAKLEAPSPASGGAVVTVSTPAQAAALAPGTRYRNPAGQEFIR